MIHRDGDDPRPLPHPEPGDRNTWDGPAKSRSEPHEPVEPDPGGGACPDRGRDDSPRGSAL